ncbi:MAG: glycosyltransferase [Ktedonobacterales bacterium]|nr:glycosyltransferase [Ktedonobacterales bacterium]
MPQRAAGTSHAGIYHPTTIAQYGLAEWNAYLHTDEERHRLAFLAQARWLVEHEVALPGGGGGWPVPIPTPMYSASRPWLSAPAQSSALSVLIRAHLLTGDADFLAAARRAADTFARDILDGGISSAISHEGICFEEVGVYPAAHVLSGFLLALIGLSDVAAHGGDSFMLALIARGHQTLHMLLDQYEHNGWTRDDLLHRRLALPRRQRLHATLLSTFAQISGCVACTAQAQRWARAPRRPLPRLRAGLARRVRGVREGVFGAYRRVFVRVPRAAIPAAPLRVSVPITAFPIMGGMRAVLAALVLVMAGEWRMEFLTRHIGPAVDAQHYEIQPFGRGIAAPWQFPNVWLYALAGWRKLLWLLRHGHRYDLILPQDGVFTGAFAAVAGKLAGRRVVCMEHGTSTLPYDPKFYAERMAMLKRTRLPMRLLSRVRYLFYWPSLRLMARITARYTDLFLVAGDEVERDLRTHLHVHPSRIIRWRFTIDFDRYAPPDAATRTHLRAARGIAEDAIVIAIAARLAPEKGIEYATKGLRDALATVSPDLRARVRVIIAGEGPLRGHIESELQEYGLANRTELWGETATHDIIQLLALSDIFLYTSTRGTNYSMAILEAMASGCAVIASTEPLTNAELLDGGRGIAIPPRDATAVAAALTRIISDMGLRGHMGHLARAYIVEAHSAAAVRRSLRRATFWAPDLLSADPPAPATSAGRGGS